MTTVIIFEISGISVMLLEVIPMWTPQYHLTQPSYKHSLYTVKQWDWWKSTNLYDMITQHSAKSKAWRDTSYYSTMGLHVTIRWVLFRSSRGTIYFCNSVDWRRSYYISKMMFFQRFGGPPSTEWLLELWLSTNGDVIIWFTGAVA